MKNIDTTLKKYYTYVTKKNRRNKVQTNTITLLFALLRSAVCEKELADKERALYSSDLLLKIYEEAQRHDVAHLLALGLKKSGMTEEGTALESEILKALYRTELRRHELEILTAALEKAEIAFFPLKGSVICEYYLEPWMRTSCDIDVLVHEEDTLKAKDVLTSEYGYEYHGKNSHDFSFFTPNKMHIELHYDLVESKLANEAAEVLKSVWQHSEERPGYKFCKNMSDEMFYFYHVAHMAKHFANGGCGIRPFIDLYILNNNVTFDAEKRQALIEKGGLAIFEKNAVLLAEIWLGGKVHTSVTQKMEEYILNGGVYGSTENLITVQQNKKGGRLQYALSKFFIPYDTIKYHYPILEKHPFLTPVMEVRRWFKLVFCGHLKRTVRELKYNSNVSSDTVNEVKNLFEDIGLK